MFSNSAFLLANDIITRATTFILYALIARYLGVYEFGQLSLALTVLFTFQILAPAGLRLFITREVAKDLTKTNLYLVNGSLIAIFFSILAYLILLIMIVLLNYSHDTTMAIFWVTLGLLPFSLTTICEAIFQGWERMQYITYANLPRNLGVIVAAFLLLSQGYGINAIACMLSISYIFLVVIEWWLVARYISRPNIKIDLRFSLETIKKSMTFLGFQGALAISNTVIIIMLSKFSGETEVGYYNAASQVLTPLTLVINSMVLSVYPALCRKFEVNTQALKLLSDNLIELSLTIALPVIIGLVYLSKEILLLLYGNEDFLLASQVLRILLITLVLRAVSSVMGRDLLAGHREKAVLKIVLITSVVYLFSGLILISKFGLMGAAITMVVFTLVDFILHYMNTSRLFSQPIPWQRLLKPLFAVGIMLGFLIFVKISSPFIMVIIGCSIYILVWVTLNIQSAGSLKQLKLKYQLLWSE